MIAVLKYLSNLFFHHLGAKGEPGFPGPEGQPGAPGLKGERGKILILVISDKGLNLIVEVFSINFYFVFGKLKNKNFCFHIKMITIIYIKKKTFSLYLHMADTK